MPDTPPSAVAVGTPPTVLITGAAKRLGRAIALLLARNGWRVAVHYHHSAQEAEETAHSCQACGADAATFSADLGDEGETRSLVPRVLAHFGGIQAVVNSASVFEHDLAQNFDYAALGRHMRANVGAPVILAHALYQHLAPQDGSAVRGAVVNLLDQKLWNQNPDFLSYTLSKAALEAATTMLALALSPKVRVVGVAPGLTLPSHFLSEQRFADLHKLSPLGQSSTPADVASTVLFALQNNSITGTTLLVDGGQHLMRFERDFSMMHPQQ
ncbi:MAG: SDR family oxidoreductase [Rhodoferax sp.]